ncbi:MAG: DUF896 domain-containing protein [Clostridia bacterium]|nr:DUF896 domain-containing protein [Clostridia bacterium]
MEREKIERINFLAKKKKAEGLTEEELAEQAVLRRQYLDEFRAGFQAQLDNVIIQNPDGSQTPLTKKKLN